MQREVYECLSLGDGDTISSEVETAVHLKHLTINVFLREEFNELVCDFIRRTHSVKSIKLKTISDEATVIAAIVYCDAIAKNPSIEKLHIAADFRRTAPIEKGSGSFIRLTEKLEAMSNVKELITTIRGIENFPYDTLLKNTRSCEKLTAIWHSGMHIIKFENGLGAGLRDNETLKELHITSDCSWNAFEICQALVVNKTLKVLIVNTNLVTKPLDAVLGAMFESNKSLERLKMPIGAFSGLGEGLAKNSTLKRLSIISESSDDFESFCVGLQGSSVNQFSMRVKWVSLWEHVKILLQMNKNSRLLEKLSIYSAKEEAIEQELLEELKDCLSQNTSLKKLSLNTVNSLLLFESLPPSLLHFKYRAPNQDCDHSLSECVLALRRLPLLQKAALSVHGDSNALDLLTSLPTQVSSLSLQVMNIFEDSTFAEVLKLLQSEVPLKKLSIQVTFNDALFVELFRVLSSNSTLKRLHVECTADSDLDSNLISSFVECLSGNYTLRHLLFRVSVFGNIHTYQSMQDLQCFAPIISRNNLLAWQKRFKMMKPILSQALH